MEVLKTSEFRWGVLGAIGVASVALSGSTVGVGIGLLILFGLWNLLYLYVIPRARLGGGIVLIYLSLFPLDAAGSLPWVTAVGGLLLAHGCWHAFMSAARLDE